MADDSAEDPENPNLPPEGTPDVESMKITREEAREVINHQIETLNNIDNKAAYTLRINIVIIGILLTIMSILVSNQSTPDVTPFANISVIGGLILSGLSIVAALWTYTSTQKFTGPNPGAINRLVNRQYTQEQWLNVLLRTYAHWMQKNERVNRQDSFALFVSHVLLFMGIGFYTFGILWGLFIQSSSVYYYLSNVVLLLILPLIVIFPRLPPVNRFTSKLWEIGEPIWKKLYN